MPKKLYFTFIDDANDALPFLWDPDLRGEPENSVSVATEQEYQIQVRDVMGASNRERTITLVEGRGAAEAVMRFQFAQENAECILVDLGEDIYCIGATMMNGSYDDGMPLITDLTSKGVDISPEVEDITSAFRSVEDEIREPYEIRVRSPEMDLG